MAWRGVVALIAVWLIGCGPTTEPTGPVGERLILSDAASVRADHVAQPDAELILAGTALDVAIRPSRSGDRFTVSLLSHDRALERERYTSTKTGFAVLEAAGETYDPPVTLLRFPMEVPSDWDWSGVVRSGVDDQPASATVQTRTETLNEPGGPYRTVRIDVGLHLGAVVKTGTTGATAPVTRTLTWWIAPGQGIIRREFGTVSSRGPRPPLASSRSGSPP